MLLQNLLIFVFLYLQLEYRVTKRQPAYNYSKLTIYDLKIIAC